MPLKNDPKIVAARKLPIFFIAAMIALLSTSYAGQGEPALCPHASVAHPIFTFSPVIAGTEVAHSFSIANKGKAILNIPGVYAG